MTATDEKTPESGDTVASTGRVARVIGPVVDVEFPADQLPEIYFALHVDITYGGNTRTLTLEVEQHLGDNLVRAISLQATDGLIRGAEVINTGAPIEVPVGDVTKGHVFNVLGETLDVPTGVYVISPQGKLLRFIPVPEDTITNNAFGGPDMKTLYVTARTSLYSVKMDAVGHAFPGGKK